MTPDAEWADLFSPEPPAPPAPPPVPRRHRSPPRETRGERASRLARQAAQAPRPPAPIYDDSPLSQDEAAALYRLGWLDEVRRRITPAGLLLITLRGGYPRGAPDDYEPPEQEMTPGGWRQVIADGRRL